MSNIYVTEPATNGKVILKTTVGEIEIELWSKEAPKACRNFVQLCMEGYYDDTAFHRLVRGFIVQGGDPTGTGEGGESVYGKPFKTEIHSRLSFNRRGLVGMACLAENMNASQFFFTLGPATELTGKHTLFGKVAGDTLFNMLRLGEGDVGPDERPCRLHRIVTTTVVLNPYDDIVPRQLPSRTKPKEPESDAVQVTAKATKNFSLLSFGEEAEEEEHVTSVVSEKLRKKGKSAHDLLSDPRLSSQPVTITDKDTELVSQATAEADKEAQERRRRRQLAMAESLETEEEKQRRILALQQEAEELRRAIVQSKRLEMELKNKEVADAERRKREAQEREEAEAEALARWEEKELLGEENSLAKEVVIDPETFSADFAGYKAKAKKAKKGADREASTMALLERFTSRLHSVVHTDSQSMPDDEKQKKVAIMDSWMASRLVSEEPVPAKQVLDPTMPHPDRYDLYDPRNPLNVRKRGGDISLDGNADHMKRKHKH